MPEAVPQVKLTKASTTSLPSSGKSLSSPNSSAPAYTKQTDAHDGLPPDSNPARGSRSTREPSVSQPSMANDKPVDAADDGLQAAIDPISRQILKRTNTQHTNSQNFFAGTPVELPPGPPDESVTRGSFDPIPMKKLDRSTSNKLTKDKKKGVSFLGRIIGGKKKDNATDLPDNESEVTENRPAGMDAEVFSQPLGFIPRFPAPPRYIKVKAQNHKNKDFDRVFLAQVLLDKQQSRSSRDSDAKIVNIDTVPTDSKSNSSANDAIWAMEFSKDGKYLAAAGQDKKLRVWAVISTPEERVENENDEVEESDDDGVRLNAPIFKTQPIREYDGHSASILDLSWSKNNFLLSSSMDKTVRLYHVSRGECLCAFKHNDFVTSIQFHPRDDRFFLAGSLDSKLRLWSIPDKSVAFWANVSDMVTAVAFTPDGKTAIAGCLNGLCTLYDTDGLKAHSQIHVRSARGRNAKGSKITGIDTITLPRDGPNGVAKLLITSNDSRIRIYNLKDRSLEIKFRGNENTCSQIHASFSDDGKYVICGSEDRKVYIWPTGAVEKQDPEKRPVEIFEAHSAIVTTAILAPTKTRQLLAQSGDPLFDLCNPPPVTLLSRTESVISSRTQTDSAHSARDSKPPSASRVGDFAKKAQGSPAYLARNVHPDGNFIVTADYTGQIKVFRQDCAYQKRRHESWDNAPGFSKKMLGRSGSVTTRTSVSSSNNNRNSLISLGNTKNPSADMILNWRNSITSNGTGGNGGGSISEVNFRRIDRTRSSSPRKSVSQNTSPRHGSTLARQHSSSATSPQSPRHPLSPQGSPQASSSAVPTLNSITGNIHATPNLVVDAPSPMSENTPTQGLAPQPDGKSARYNPVPHDVDDDLFLQGNQSFMYWNMKSNMAPMAERGPRTPGLLTPNGDPLSRAASYVSQLSSEHLSSAGSNEQEVEGEELKCAKCGGEEFKATIVSRDGAQKLRCKRCGTIV